METAATRRAFLQTIQAYCRSTERGIAALVCDGQCRLQQGEPDGMAGDRLGDSGAGNGGRSQGRASSCGDRSDGGCGQRLSHLSLVQSVWRYPPTVVAGLFPSGLRAREQATGQADSSGRGEQPRKSGANCKGAPFSARPMPRPQPLNSVRSCPGIDLKPRWFRSRSMPNQVVPPKMLWPRLSAGRSAVN